MLQDLFFSDFGEVGRGKRSVVNKHVSKPKTKRTRMEENKKRSELQEELLISMTLVF